MSRTGEILVVVLLAVRDVACDFVLVKSGNDLCTCLTSG